MLDILLDAAYALLSGEFSHWWAAHKEKKAQDVANKDAADSNDDAVAKLSKWTRKD